jgi:hypothetical protein
MMMKMKQPMIRKARSNPTGIPNNDSRDLDRTVVRGFTGVPKGRASIET